MSSKVSIYDRILAVLALHKDGIKMNALNEAMEHPPSRRTLSRRLAELIARGEVYSEGQRNGTRYFLSRYQPELSTVSSALKENVSQPLNRRISVGYNPDFLYSYEPNVTFYLPVAVRERLKSLGDPFPSQLSPGVYIKRVYNTLLVDLCWNSSRLEGNTYSLLETNHLVHFGAEAVGKSPLETQMILNHKRAIEFLVEDVEQLRLQKNTLLHLHLLLSNKLLGNPKGCGALRDIPVAIGGTVYKPTAVLPLLEECFTRIIAVANAIEDPFEQAFFMMVHIPYLQPFADVNKRTSRLAANIPLITHNMAPLSFIDVDREYYIGGLLAVYEYNKVDLLRDIFVWAYEQSAKRYPLEPYRICEPEVVAVRYGDAISKLIYSIVMDNIRGKAILEKVHTYGQRHIPNYEQIAFERYVEMSLIELYPHNCMLYDIPPSALYKWKIQ